LRAEGENALNHHTACLLCGAALGLMTIFRPKTIRGVTYALDHANEQHERGMRANIDVTREA